MVQSGFKEHKAETAFELLLALTVVGAPAARTARKLSQFKSSPLKPSNYRKLSPLELKFSALSNRAEYYRSKIRKKATFESIQNMSATRPLGVKKTLAHRPSWMSNRLIEATGGKTTTLIGNYKKDTRAVLDELNYSKSTDFGPKKGSFNLLNVPDELVKEDKFWKEFNEPWLKAVTDRKDVVVVLSSPVDGALSKTRKPTGFGKELDFMNRLVTEGKYKFIPEHGKYVPIQ